MSDPWLPIISRLQTRGKFEESHHRNPKSEEPRNRHPVDKYDLYTIWSKTSSWFTRWSLIIWCAVRHLECSKMIEMPCFRPTICRPNFPLEGGKINLRSLRAFEEMKINIPLFFVPVVAFIKSPKSNLLTPCRVQSHDCVYERCCNM